MKKVCSMMKQELYLPQEIWREILGRLPIRSMVQFKCVCKSWRNLIKSHAPKPCLAFAHQDKMGYAVCDEACQPLVRFALPPPHDQYATLMYHRVIIDSANGLLLLWDGLDNHPNNLFIVNPMTFEYVELPPQSTRRCLFGFGVSKLSGQYKVLCVDRSRSCDLYTLGGGGLWRSIPAAAATRIPDINSSSLLDYILYYDGNLHWLATNFEDKFVVCCFDLETEVFTSFSLPPRDRGYSIGTYGAQHICVLDAGLWLCDLADRHRIVIWKMGKYQDSNSWIIEYTFGQTPCIHDPDALYIVFPLKVFANGDLLVCINGRLLIYSKTTQVMVRYGFLQRSYYRNLRSTIMYTPSFLSLKTMGIKDVQSLVLY